MISTLPEYTLISIAVSVKCHLIRDAEWLINIFGVKQVLTMWKT